VAEPNHAGPPVSTDPGLRPTRRRLLDAAAVALARDGLDVSMEAIAAAAGVTRMTVYRQLGTRDQLLVAVLLDQSAVVVSDLRTVLDRRDRSFGDRLVDAIVVVVEATRASPVLTFFVQGVTPTQVDALDPDEQFLGRVWALLLPYFEAAADAGELAHDAVPTLEWTLRQILLQLTVAGATTGSEAGLRAELERFFIPSIIAPVPG
jgi:AcrR family transcriptional regulator